VIALLDLNVLLALAWPKHQQHTAIHSWFESHAQFGWATCTLTQLGFVRLSSNRTFTPDPATPSEAAELLRSWTQHPHHIFWESPSAEDPAIFTSCIGHQQVNDAWLVHTAALNRGRIVTFDRQIAAHTTRKDLVVLLET
jgi:toxin-antitoxin system PIN domain toxin